MTDVEYKLTQLHRIASQHLTSSNISAREIARNSRKKPPAPPSPRSFPQWYGNRLFQIIRKLRQLAIVAPAKKEGQAATTQEKEMLKDLFY